MVNIFILIWENFDVNKISNVGFKLDVVEFIENYGECIGEIEFEDI